ncbi:hypothetical protein ACH41H_24930 [Streptomyces sp. NPDC020800]|uniref:hypothetical protein n=1 Tax=Streptomyces sp. NPDC020800 TaxID=3365092 RepID=UPI003797B9AD
MTTTHPTRVDAVIIGAGYAGLLAASMISLYDVDVLVLAGQGTPAGADGTLPATRPGQVLHVGGINDVQDLVYGSVAELRARGAQDSPLPPLRGSVIERPQRDQPPLWGPTGLLSCSQELLNAVLRNIVVANPGHGRETRVWDDAVAVGFIGDEEQVRGVRVRLGGDVVHEVIADLVVDASGADSLTPSWLTAMGHSNASVSTTATSAWASRLYRAPAGHEAVPVTAVADGAHSAVLVPIENGMWMVSQTTSASEELTDGSAFEKAALALSDPRVGDLISQAAPLGEVDCPAATESRWRRYDQARTWPRRLVVLGDACATFSPGRACGPQAAEASVRALRLALADGGLAHPTLARRAQRGIGKEIARLWPQPALARQPAPNHRPLTQLVGRAGTAFGRLIAARAS